MSDEIPSELVDRMMVKCTRRCCICRRFRPTKLQVHHIKERNQGGTNDEDNLIVVCFSCHSDVHTKVPFARRFSWDELKGHRDALVKMVGEGQLPSGDTDDADEVIAHIVSEMRLVAHPKVNLLPEAVKILLSAVQVEGVHQGTVAVMEHRAQIIIQLVNRNNLVEPGDARSQARYRKGLSQLVEAGLLDQLSRARYLVTYEGYLAADEILVCREQTLDGGEQ